MNPRSAVLSLVACALLPLAARGDGTHPLHILVWDERQPEQKVAYDGGFLGDHLARQLALRPGVKVTSVGIDDPEQGLSAANLDDAHVLIWWGHVRHGEIKPETAREIARRVAEGKLALIVLHSGLSSRPFKAAMREKALLDAAFAAVDREEEPKAIEIVAHDPGPADVRPLGSGPITPSFETSTPEPGRVRVDVTLPACSIGAWKEEGKPSHVTVLRPDHPIAAGLPKAFDIPHTEMYDEPFQVPEPDAVILEERWDDGQHFRSGLVWTVGRGKVFYFRPGHETYPVFRQAETLKVIENAVDWLTIEATPHGEATTGDHSVSGQ